MTYISTFPAIPVIAGGYFLNFLKIVQGEFFMQKLPRVLIAKTSRFFGQYCRLLDGD